MNIKIKIALNLSLLFSFFLGMILIIIYLFFAEFRKDEFVNVLKDRISTISNYFNGDENIVDGSKMISDTPTYSIQKEEVAIFNEKFKLILNSIKDGESNWNGSDLDVLQREGAVYRRDNTVEIYGEKIGERYFLIASEDVMGKEKLKYLGSLMLVSFIVASSLVWVLSFLFAKKMMAPLDIFQEKITRISANNLTERLPENDKKDEINLLAKVFNTMLGRIDRSYSSQKEFNASASHEIKTPLTRMAFQLENLAKIENGNPETRKYIHGISEEVYRISDTVDSLLLLSKLEEEHLRGELSEVRIDEVIFDVFENVKRYFENFELHFNIKEDSETGNLTVKGIQPLLEIVFINLFKNVCLYADRPEALVDIFESRQNLWVVVKSWGEVISVNDSRKIFEAFQRGANSQQKTGSGLGLRICKRILDFHGAKISYHSESSYNVFTLEFSAG